VVTAVSAAPSRRNAFDALVARGRGDRDVRGTIDSEHRGKKTPTLVTRIADTSSVRMTPRDRTSR
jgi:hypothetical protein